MSPRTYETAAEFCKLVGTPNLLDYLGLPPDCTMEEARAKLKARRKYMQGMQSNPKYKKEALFLIKSFSELNAVLGEPGKYLADANKRAESDHLPVLEMTIKGVLAGGTLSREQEDYLARNASELGVSDDTFQELMERLTGEAGVARPRVVRAAITFEEMFPDPDDITDFYRVLGVDPYATRDQIFLAYAEQKQAANTLPHGAEAADTIQRVEKAWTILGDDGIREQYDLSRRRTGPPARNREGDSGPLSKSSEINTAPPVRPREPEGVPRPTHTGATTLPLDGLNVPRDALGASTHPTLPTDSMPAPPRPARLEILGDPVRTVWVGQTTVVAEVVVRNGGEQQMSGRVSTDVPWLLAQPSRLDPRAKEQTISVRISPKELPDRHDTGVVTIQTDRGDRASVVFEVMRKRDLRPILAVTVLSIFAIGAAFGLAYAFMNLTQTEGTTGLTVNVDPMADDITVNAKSVGSGSSAYVADPPLGEVTLQVLHPNFKPYTQLVTVAPGQNAVVDVTLELARPLDFTPRPDMDKASVEQAVAQRVMTPRSREMDQCVRKGMRDGEPLKGIIRVHISRSGWASGWEIEGGGEKNAVVRRCVERQAAAVIFPPLKDGDYATVRYEYNVR